MGKPVVLDTVDEKNLTIKDGRAERPARKNSAGKNFEDSLRKGIKRVFSPLVKSVLRLSIAPFLRSFGFFYVFAATVVVVSFDRSVDRSELRSDRVPTKKQVFLS